MSKLIFIVDDEQSISKLLSFWVKDKWGYEVELFANSESMLKKMSLKPDLVLLDIMLPGRWADLVRRRIHGARKR